jgi:menaquinol-cytochrome c reductase iron-sulfur subunit
MIRITHAHAELSIGSVPSHARECMTQPEAPSNDSSAAEPSAMNTAALATRRRFLRIASVVSAAFTGLLIGVPAVRTFLSPALKPRAKKDWIKVAQADQIDIGTPVKVDFTETVTDAWVETRALRSVWLRTEDGETFTAWSGICTHLGCAFGIDAERKVFHCPCHHGLFDLETGKVVGGPPPRALDLLPVRVVGGAVQIMLKQFRAGISEKVEV